MGNDPQWPFPFIEIGAWSLHNGSGQGTTFKIKEKRRMIEAFNGYHPTFTGQPVGGGPLKTISMESINVLWVSINGQCAEELTREGMTFDV